MHFFTRATGKSIIAALAVTFAVISFSGTPAAARSIDLDQDTPTPPNEGRKVLITGDRLGGLVLPIEPIKSDLILGTTETWRWVVDDTQRLLLKGEVNIDLGSYAFSAKEAVVWINRLPSEQGLVNQVAIWFTDVSEPTRRAGLGATGRNVLVTASLIGKVRLRSVLMNDDPPRDLRTVRKGEERLARYLRTLVSAPLPSLDRRPQVQIPEPPPPPILVPGGSLATPRPTPDSGEPATMLVPDRNQSQVPIFSPQGMVSFSGDDVVIDEQSDSITVVGSMQIDYDSNGARDEYQRLSLASQRGVVFLAPGTIREMRAGSGRVDAEAITGIYLEGGVRATDGEYTLRGSSIYYDFPRNKAIILDAILRTYTRSGRQLPIVARAREMQQVSADQWRADKATVSTSEFFQPHIGIGMNRVTITERPVAEGGRETLVKGEGVTIRANGIPFFFWPGFESTAESSPLVSLRSGWQRDKGMIIGTSWNAFGLLGLEKPDWGDARLRVDGFTERGPALGLELDLGTLGPLKGGGRFEMYGLYDFGGNDRTSGGENVNINEEMRGQVVGEYQAKLSPDLMLQAQIAYLSDQTWAATWRQREYQSRREYESSLYLDFSPKNTSLSVLARSNLNNFLSNGWKLADRPYFVEKMPEIDYTRVGDDLFNTLTWNSSYGFSRMSLQTTAGTPGSLGVDPRAFATNSRSTSIDSLYEESGYNDDDVLRFHTRQELSIPFSGESWNVTPFIFGRFTGYMDGNWAEYRTMQGIDPDQDNYRIMAGGGARANTSFERVHDGVQSDLFDINRLRHIIEPNATLFYAWDSLPNGSFPIYDQSIEGATAAAAAQVGLRQTLQTQRGGPGNWTSVDFLKVDVGAVFNDSSDNFQRNDVIAPNPIPGSVASSPYNPYAWVQSPYPQFYGYEPELSQWGTHAYANVVWELSSTFTIGGSGLFGWQDREVIDLTGSAPETRTMNGLMRGSIGVQMNHSPDTSTYLEYRYLGATDDELLQAGVIYRIGRRYQASFNPQYDVVRGEFRAFNASVRRTFPDFDMIFNVGYGIITDETTVGLRLSIPRQAGEGIRTY